MIVISGCPRSGTSVMMDCFRHVYSDDKIIGNEFPQNRDPIQGENETDSHFEIRKWMYEQNKREDDFSDLNPNGFWECRYSVQGIRYNYADKKNLQKYLHEKSNNRSIIKIVSQGLLQSDPRYISKIVYMNRHPRNVAKSQERLKRGLEIRNFNGENQNMFDGVTIHTPEMYINVTLHACRFFLDNPHIPVHFVNFDDLQSNPIEEQKKLQEFIGYGDWSKAKDVVTPKLNRSNWEDVDNILWEEAQWLWDHFTKQEFQKCLDYFQDPHLNINKLQTKWQCPRSNTVVNRFDCEKCVDNPVVRENFKARAQRQNVEWITKPCLFECGLDVENDNPISIEDSIKNNSWNK